MSVTYDQVSRTYVSRLSLFFHDCPSSIVTMFQKWYCSFFLYSLRATISRACPARGEAQCLGLSSKMLRFLYMNTHLSLNTLSEHHKWCLVEGCGRPSRVHYLCVFLVPFVFFKLRRKRPSSSTNAFDTMGLDLGTSTFKRYQRSLMSTFASARQLVRYITSTGLHSTGKPSTNIPRVSN